MGSAIAAQCAARGARVVGLEQYPRGHDLGASTGRTRMIRKAYFEDPAYVPLLHRTYELWRALEHETGEDLLRTCGVLAVGRENSEIIAGIRRAAREHDLTIEVLDRAQVRARFPMLRLRDDEVAILEPGAGVLAPERCNAAHLTVAERHGATLQFEVAMRGWTFRDDVFDVELGDGSRVSARSLVLALGPWVQSTLAGLGVQIRVQRNVQAWFAPGAGARYSAAEFPAFLVERDELPAPLYGFPDFGDGVKAAFHGAGELADPLHLNREIHHARDVAPIARAMDDWMPGAAARFLEAKACMYSLTPDEHFIVDRHPTHKRLIVCGGFSGHGFKFVPVIGEIAADLIVNGETQHPIEFLSLGRFHRSA